MLYPVALLKLFDGLMVTALLLNVTLALPTAMVSIGVPEALLITILPVPAVTFSLNVRTILLSIATLP